MATSRLSDREQRSRQVLNLLMNVLSMTDSYIGQRSGFSQQMVNDRRNGRTRIRLEDRENLANAIGVPDYLFDMEPVDVLRWLADNGRDLLVSASPCITTPLVCAA